MIKDFLGHEVNLDDYFAYPLTIGRSANMAIFQFKDLNKNGNVKALPIKRSYKNDLFRYKKWIGSALVELTEAEKIKVDSKLSTLTHFSRRAILLKDFKIEKE
jgi:hypothetical protein